MAWTQARNTERAQSFRKYYSNFWRPFFRDFSYNSINRISYLLNVWSKALFFYKENREFVSRNAIWHIFGRSPITSALFIERKPRPAPIISTQNTHDYFRYFKKMPRRCDDKKIRWSHYQIFFFITQPPIKQHNKAIITLSHSHSDSVSSLAIADSRLTKPTRFFYLREQSNSKCSSDL